jgi:hypothetical protein
MRHVPAPIAIQPPPVLQAIAGAVLGAGLVLGVPAWADRQAPLRAVGRVPGTRAPPAAAAAAAMGAMAAMAVGGSALAERGTGVVPAGPSSMAPSPARQTSGRPLLALPIPAPPQMLPLPQLLQLPQLPPAPRSPRLAR